MTTDRPLGRRVPSDFEHVDKYPISTAAAVALAPTPAVIGVNWYPAFDDPEQGSDGYWYVKMPPPGQRVRGGHCVAIKPLHVGDNGLRWWDFYDQGTEGACSRAGTLIRMEDGSHKAVEDVRTGDRVATAEGRSGLVTATFMRFHGDGLVKARLIGHEGLAVTAEHPILTSRGYVPAGELRLGDEVALTRYLAQATTELHTEPFLRALDRRVRRDKRMVMAGGVATQVTAVPETIDLTAAFGRLIGLFLAEGGTTPNKVQWAFGKHERDTLVAETVTLIRDCLGAEARVQERAHALNVVLYGKHWRVLFEQMLCHGPYDKRLPGDLAAGPLPFLEGIWQGWIAGDGWWDTSRSRMKAVTVSHGLALDMFAIGQALGVRPTLRLRRGQPGPGVKARRDYWEITLSTGGFSTRSRQDEAAVWRKVTALEHEEFAGFVFNFEVEGDNSYVAEGIGVHNCVGFGCSRVMSLMNRKRYFARWLWDRAKEVDEWSESNPGDAEGTSVRAALDVLRTRGHVPYYASLYEEMNTDGEGGDWIARSKLKPTLSEGIQANRWIRSIEDLQEVVGYQAYGFVDVINSWGRDYPHFTRFPLEVVERLWNEDGEIGVVTDR